MCWTFVPDVGGFGIMSENKELPAGAKEKWKPFQLTYAGNLSETVLGGGGKLSRPGGDPGESRKPNQQQ
jgi:hypothetical protein